MDSKKYFQEELSSLHEQISNCERRIRRAASDWKEWQEELRRLESAVKLVQSIQSETNLDKYTELVLDYYENYAFESFTPEPVMAWINILIERKKDRVSKRVYLV